VAWWDPHGECLTNCSFSGGEASSAFWTLVPAALAPPQWRAVSYALSIAFGSAVGLLRIAFGRHFFTDVFFSGVLNYVALWIMHGLFYRWPRTRLCEPRLERDLDQILSWLRTRARRISGNS
jgi:membrane-associated phospholipid phosphatase